MGRGLSQPKSCAPFSCRPHSAARLTSCSCCPSLEKSYLHKCYPRIKLIEKWKERNGPRATYRHLAESLYRADAVDSVHVLCTELGAPPTETDGASLPATGPPPQHHMEHAGVCSPLSLVTCPVHIHVGIHNHYLYILQYTRFFLVMVCTVHIMY